MRKFTIFGLLKINFFTYPSFLHARDRAIIRTITPIPSAINSAQDRIKLSKYTIFFHRKRIIKALLHFNNYTIKQA